LPFELQAWFLLTVNRLFKFLRETRMDRKTMNDNSGGTVISRGLARNNGSIGDENGHLERVRNGTNL
jgi:hypothetical protein